MTKKITSNKNALIGYELENPCDIYLLNHPELEGVTHSHTPPAKHHQPSLCRGCAKPIEQPQTHPAAINPRRLELDADGERGSHRETGKGRGPNAPTGAITATADPVPRPPLWWLLGRLSLQRPLDGCPPSERPRETGPHRTPPRGGLWPLRAPKRCPPAPPAACGRWRKP